MRALLTTIAVAYLAFQGLSFEARRCGVGWRHSAGVTSRQPNVNSKRRSERTASARAWKLLGMTYIAEEKYEAAEESCRKACDLDPREENACYYWGRVDFTLGRFANALEAYQKALANSVDAGRALLGLALTYEAMSQPGDAERYYTACDRRRRGPRESGLRLVSVQAGTRRRKPYGSPAGRG